VSDEDVVDVEGDVLENVMDEDDVDDVLDEELEEFKTNVRYNVPNHDIDDDMIGNVNIDYDDDMANPFNIIYEPNDMDVELDEEEY
jgi:hypothetical protein